MKDEMRKRANERKREKNEKEIEKETKTLTLRSLEEPFCLTAAHTRSV